MCKVLQLEKFIRENASELNAYEVNKIEIRKINSSLVDLSLVCRSCGEDYFVGSIQGPINELPNYWAKKIHKSNKSYENIFY